MYCVAVGVLSGPSHAEEVGKRMPTTVVAGAKDEKTALMIQDAFITMINLEQMMFFYRLYYADWYIGLYMLINGLLYSSIGSWLGYKVGIKLQQVMGE